MAEVELLGLNVVFLSATEYGKRYYDMVDWRMVLHEIRYQEFFLAFSLTKLSLPCRKWMEVECRFLSASLQTLCVQIW